MPDFLAQIRDARWLNGRSVTRYSLLVLLIAAGQVLLRLAAAHDLIARDGVPIGADFISFYAASKLALSGHMAQVWQPGPHHAALNSVFHKDLGDWGFFYPPPYLLICLPLALLPYGGALVTWIAATYGALAAAVRAWWKKLAPDAAPPWLPMIAFPGVWLNIACGQNAALTAAIIATGCWLLPTAPVASGVVFGLMIVKPQLAVALPFVLLASGRWRTVLAMGATAAVVAAVAYAVVGPGGYSAFLADSALARAALDRGLVDFYNMQSVFGAFKVLGAGNSASYTAQAVVSVTAVLWAAVTAYRHRTNATAVAALAVSAILLATPFMLDYDLMLSAIPLVWLVAQGIRTGFRPWEKMVCVLVFLLPLVARGLAGTYHLPLSALILMALLSRVVARVNTLPAVRHSSWKMIRPAAA